MVAEWSWTGVTATTTSFNSTFLRLGRRFASAFRLWYDVGWVAGSLLMGLSTIFLTFSLVTKSWHIFCHFLVPSVGDHDIGQLGNETKISVEEEPFQFEVVPLIPGLTIPLNHLFYIWVAAAISLVVHEAGHALAATSQDVRVESSGVHILFFPPIPAAFVNVARQDDHATLARGRLRIYFAGVWHNLVLCAVVFVFWKVTVACLGSLCLTRDSILVSSVHPRSAVSGSIFRGDILEAINGMAIEMTQDFVTHIDDITYHRDRQPGFCIPNREHPKFHPDASAGDLRCCQAHSDDTSRQCFTSHQAGLSPLWFGNTSDDAVTAKLPRNGFKCATYKDLHGLALRMCQGHSDKAHSHDCPINHDCFFPVLHTNEIMARLTSRHLASTSSTRPKHTLYLGRPEELVASMRLLQGAPASWIRALFRTLPRRLSRWLLLDLPQRVFPALCSYTISVSAGVAFLNVLPIWAFDGAHVLTVALVVAPMAIDKRQTSTSILDTEPERTAVRVRMRTWMLNVGTVAFIANSLATAVVMIINRSGPS